MSTGVSITTRRITFSLLTFFLLLLTTPLHAAPPAGDGTPTPEFTPPPFRSQHFQDLPQLPGAEAPAPSSQAPQAAALYPWARLTFQSLRDNNWEIYSGNDDGSGQTRLTYDGATDMQPRLNRGATRLVFASKRTGNYEIFAMNSDGSGLIQLTFSGADDAGPYWSPDGSKIVFQAYRDGQAEIYVMNADGSGQTRLTSNGGYDGEPSWSPDGTQIAFVSKRTGGSSDYFLWVMNADGSNQHQLVALPYVADPVWSPDGTKIAFDAAGGDGWQNLWVVIVNTTYYYIVFDEGGYADAWAGSWSPDGQYVAFTRIYYTIYNNQWYWTYAYLDVCRTLVPNSIVTRLSATGMDWRPDWQSTDISAPTSSMTPLPAESPSPITVRWSAFDIGASGVQQYNVQMRDGVNGAWADWNGFSPTATSAAYPGVGGHTYYFRVRARDNASNVEAWPADYDAMTTVEALPPNSTVQALPKYVKNNTLVQWGGADPGGSGIQSYDIQYQDVTAGGGWVNWQTGITATTATFGGEIGHQYHFRSRAVDRAQNAEDWPLNEDTQATLYAWGIAGYVYDNTGVPVSSATITTTPAAGEAFTSNVSGLYAAYVLTSTNTYTTTWNKNGYGSLPATGFGALADANLNVYLPPTDNLMLNGDFEVENLETSGWVTSGEITPTLVSSQDSAREAIVFVRPQPGMSGNADIWIMNPDGTNETQLTTYAGEDRWPTLSPDGSKVAYVSNRNGVYQLWMMNSDGTNAVQILVAGNIQSPQWSYDGSRLTYQSDAVDWWEVWIVNADGTNAQRLTTHSEAAGGSSWSPDGQKLVYLSEPTARYHDLHLINSDGTGQALLTSAINTGYSHHRPSWSPDGAQIATIRYPAGSFGPYDLWLMNTDGTHGSTLVQNIDSIVLNQLSWSTDGQWIVFSKNGQIWKVRKDGSELTQINSTGWEPDAAISLSTLQSYTGSRGILLGTTVISQTGASILQHQVTIPVTMSTPVLSFLYSTPANALSNTGNEFKAQITNGLSTTTIFSTTANIEDWLHTWIDLSTWVGQSVTITFQVQQAPDNPRVLVYLDDISLGSAHPDVWTQIDSPLTTPPGGLATFSLTYGNQGGAPASGVLLTATLPSEFNFVEASLPPITTTPALVWDVGDLAGKSGPYTITITATVAPTATTFINVTSQADIATHSDELETANNVAQASTFIGNRIYLPLIAR